MLSKLSRAIRIADWPLLLTAESSDANGTNDHWPCSALIRLTTSCHCLDQLRKLSKQGLSPLTLSLMALHDSSCLQRRKLSDRTLEVGGGGVGRGGGGGLEGVGEWGGGERGGLSLVRFR